MSTRVHDPINVREGELVSLMRSRCAAYGNVSSVLDVVRGKLTDIERAKVSVTAPGVVYLGIWVDRDCIGQLIEVPEPVCNVCEETIECACVRHTV